MIIQILGAAGAGKSTLGRALAARTGLPLLQSDRYLWQDGEFTQTRPVEERRALLLQDLARCPSCIVDGGVGSWLEEGVLRPDLLVLVRLESGPRMERLRAREQARFGRRCLPGGDHEATTREFLEWAATYDTATEESNCLAAHMQRLCQARCPCLILWSHRPAEALAAQVAACAGL